MSVLDGLASFVGNGIEELLDHYEDRSLIGPLKGDDLRRFIIEIKNEKYYVTIERKTT